MPRHTRSTLSCLALVTLLPVATTTAPQIGVDLGAEPTVLVAPGSALVVPITVNLAAAAGTTLASLQAELEWGAERLTFDSLRLVQTDWNLSTNTTGAASGAMSFGAFSASALPATAVLLNAYFTAQTPGGTRVRLTPVAAGDANGASALPLLRPGQLDVCVAVPGNWGDVTGDGRVGIVDAQQIARFALGLDVVAEGRVMAAGDVTADGTVDILDAQQLARFTVDLPAATRTGTNVYSPPEVASVGINPDTAMDVPVGAAAQLTATPRNLYGDDVSGCTGINWASSNLQTAAVSPSGLVSALAPGNAMITARSATSPAASASVALSVFDQAAQATLFFREPFENGNFRSRGWYDNTTAVLSTTQKHAGNSAIEFRFLQGGRTPVSGGAMRRKFTPSNSVYISYWVKYSDNWVGSGVAYHPHEFHVLSTADTDYTGPALAFLTLYLEHSYQNGGRPLLGMQDNRSINLGFGQPPINLTAVTENRSVSGCNGVLEANVRSECYAIPGANPPWYNSKMLLGPVVLQPNPGPGYKGNWNFVEAYFQLNTVANGVGQTDGIIQYWFNGALVLDRRDIIFRTAAQAIMRFSQFVIAQYIGPGSPIEQTMWVDDLTVASGRIQ